MLNRLKSILALCKVDLDDRFCEHRAFFKTEFTTIAVVIVLP